MKAIERSCVLRHAEKIKEKELRTILQKLIGQESRMPGVFRDDILQVKQELELVDEERYRGALVRARAEHWAAGETSTKRALGIERAHTRWNRIDEIKWKGRATTEKHEIKNAFFEHFQALVAYQTVDVERFQKYLVVCLPRLDNDVKEVLEQPI